MVAGCKLSKSLLVLLTLPDHFQQTQFAQRWQKQHLHGPTERDTHNDSRVDRTAQAREGTVQSVVSTKARPPFTETPRAKHVPSRWPQH